MTEGSKEEHGNMEKNHLMQTGIVIEDFPEEGVAELMLR